MKLFDQGYRFPLSQSPGEVEKNPSSRDVEAEEAALFRVEVSRLCIGQMVKNL